MRRVLASISLIAAAMTMMVAGCSPSSEGPERLEPDIEMVNITDLRTFALPLDAYRIHGEYAALVSRASFAIFQSCMARFGFTEEALRTESTVEAPTGNERLYGLADLEQAQASGYHPPNLDTGPDQSDQPVLSPEATEAWHMVANGTVPETEDGLAVPPGGCVGEARRILAEGTPPADLPLAERLSGETFQRATEDSRIQEAFREWSACMADAGYEYRDPQEAINDPRWATEQPTEQEIAVAVTDVRCKQQVNLINTWASVQIAYQEQAIDEHAEALKLIEEYLQIQEANALEILEQTS